MSYVTFLEELVSEIDKCYNQSCFLCFMCQNYSSYPERKVRASLSHYPEHYFEVLLRAVRLHLNIPEGCSGEAFEDNEARREWLLSQVEEHRALGAQQ